MSRLVGAVARILMAPVFIKGGINQVKKAHRLAPAVDAALEEYGIEVSASGEKLVKLNGIGMTVAGGALALGVFPRTSALTLAGLLVPTTIVGQAFWRRTSASGRPGSPGRCPTRRSSAACCSWRPDGAAEPRSDGSGYFFPWEWAMRAGPGLPIREADVLLCGCARARLG